MLDQYQEIAPIGKYKNIWLVFERNSGKVYVKKCLETFNQAVYERVARLNNIHIPAIIEWERKEDRLWLIEEYVGGETLEERMNGGHSFTRKEAVGIVRQVCEALTCLHSQKPPVIHRDVKLSNIMVSYEGVVKLIDYNAARLYEKGQSQDTRLIGTEAYAAPEQFGFAQTDARTDIYALGVVFNYLLTGEHINNRIAKGACGAVIRKCTQMDPKQRYQSAAELDKALRAIENNAFAEETAETEAETEKEDPGRENAAAREEKKEDSRPVQKTIWPIPGFRSGSLWKMLLAIAGYLLIFYVCLTVEFEIDAGRPLALWTDRIIMLFSMLFTVAVYTDYRGAAAKMPFLHSKKKGVRQMGYCMVFPLILALLIMIKELVLSLFRII